MAGSSDFINELTWRGLIHQATTQGLAEHLGGAPRTAYAGFDPTADSLTVGNLVPIMMLAHWQRAGHRPIVLQGGGTGLIGDPSGKSAERQLLSRDQVRHNVEQQRTIFSQVLDLDAGGAARGEVMDNADWLSSIGYLEVLRDIGKHFSVNQMIARDSVATRLATREQGISYTEFSYMILQAYDFLHLQRTRGCTVQLGGADQWGNIVSGIDLIRRCVGADAFGVTAPLVTRSDGGKFGKSESGAVWLSAERTSPYRFFQFWLQTADADTAAYLRWFTFLSRQRIAELEGELSSAPQARAAQRALAAAVTEMFHGPTERERCEAAGRALFSGEVRKLDEAQVRQIAADLPQGTVSPAELAGEGFPLVDALIRCGLAKSKREAREFLTSGSVLLNGDSAAAESRVSAGNLLHGRFALLRRGKREWAALTLPE